MTKECYKITKIVLVIVVCFVIGYASWLSFRKVGDVYLDEMELTITGIKQDFLKNTVDNLIREIDVARELEANYYERVVDRRYETLSYEAHLTDEDFVAYFINRFRGDADRQTGPDYWTALLWNNISGEILYDPSGVFQGDLPSTIALLQTELRYFRTIDHGEVTGLWGVGSQLIEEHTQARVAEKIRNLEFDGGSYIWVNGVLNYDGGPDYAIRVVHPNFPETEGTYLSTETTDLKGNTPYLTELEGVKEHGELFFRYWFKKLHSDEISEKLTYARLYQDYDWIIAMGIHIDDMERYIAQTSS
ncbi:MAG: diguanylate cyclase, partial [Firmicutes bacterium]|nr:diguanylate cyclase [Bacillota bacterium]